MGLFTKFLNLFKSGDAKEREANVEEYEDLFLESDFGSSLSYHLSELLLKKAKEDKVKDASSIRNIIKDELSSLITSFDFEPQRGDLSVALLLGVNGSGKTTTAAKLGKLFKNKGYSVILGAADTFRAAASEQLVLHGERLSIPVVAPVNAGNPAAVVYDTLDAAASKKSELALIDTAGRLHTKDNLIKEMQKVDKIVNSRVDKEHYYKFLVLDATSGQNLFNQASVFTTSLGIDAIILTKLDSGSKGGAVIRISKELNLPIVYTCTGEGYDDIKKFDKDEFLENLLK